MHANLFQFSSKSCSDCGTVDEVGELVVARSCAQPQEAHTGLPVQLQPLREGEELLRVTHDHATKCLPLLDLESHQD